MDVPILLAWAVNECWIKVPDKAPDQTGQKQYHQNAKSQACRGSIKPVCMLQPVEIKGYCSAKNMLAVRRRRCVVVFGSVAVVANL